MLEVFQIVVISITVRRQDQPKTDSLLIRMAILKSNNYAVLNEIKSTKDFWIKNVNALPDLKRLALILI